jgi:hypothetical protein
MFSLVSLCSAVFQSSTPLQMKFFEYDPIQSRCTFEYQKCANHVFEFLRKFGNFWGPGFHVMKFCSYLPDLTLLLVDVD